MEVTVKYIGSKQRVVNGTVWYPGEVWKIDPRIVHAEGIEDLVEIQGEPVPNDVAQQLRHGSETLTDAAQGADQVVLNRSTLQRPLTTAQSQTRIKVKKD